MSKAKFDAAKQLIGEKKYAEARSILSTIDHPTARQWEAKLDQLAPSTKEVMKPQSGLQKTWRVIWGFLALVSAGWICYGFYVANYAANAVSRPDDGAAEQIGTALGTSIGIGFFLCTGLPFFVVFAFLFWRNNVAITRARRHADTINALRSRS